MIDDKALVEQLAQIAALRAADVLTEQEFVLAKAQVLGSQPAAAANSGAGTIVAASHGLVMMGPAQLTRHFPPHARRDRIGSASSPAVSVRPTSPSFSR